MPRAKKTGQTERPAAPAASEAPEATPRTGKLATLITLLRSTEGATIAAMCAATGWQAHSVRGAMAGSLSRKGFVVSSHKPEDGPRCYRIGELA